MFQAWPGRGAGGAALPTTAQAEHNHLRSTSAGQLQKEEYKWISCSNVCNSYFKTVRLVIIKLCNVFSWKLAKHELLYYVI